MKHNYAKLLGLLLVLALVLSGCNLIGVDQIKELDQQIADAAAKNAQVAATYEGGAVTRGDVYYAYNNQLTQIYNQYSQLIQAGYYSSEQIVADVQQFTLESAVQDAAIAKLFDERGMTIADEKLAEIEEEVEEHYQEGYDAIYNDTDGKKDDVRVKQTELAMTQLGFTKDMLRNSHLAQERAQLLEEAVKAEITEEDVTDEMVETAYQEKVDADEASYANGGYSFDSATTNGRTIYWYPEGYRTVRHILVTVDEEVLNAVSDARQAYDSATGALEDLQAELAAAQSGETEAAEGTNEAAEEVAEARSAEDIQADIDAKQAELTDLQAAVDAAEAACIESAKATLDEIYARIDAGEDFADLVAEYGEDPGMKKEPGLTQGYYVGEKSAVWDSHFTAAAMALENVGDVTATPAISSSGLHIIRYESDVASGAVALDDDMRQTLKAEVLETKQQEHYDQLVEDAVAALNPQYTYSALSAN